MPPTTPSAPDAAHIFLDTNIALHYKRADQIDWHALCGARRIVLVGAPIFFRELEHQRVHNPSKKLRARATEYAKWVVQFVRDPNLTISADVSWRFPAVEPAIDFAAQDLSRLIADDQLIASVLAYPRGDDFRIFVATADIGLELKLRSRQIAPLLLPDDYRLPDEPDPQEKELQTLRRQVAQQRAPRLALISESGNNRHTLGIRPQVIVPSAPSLAEVRQNNAPAVIEPPGQVTSLDQQMRNLGSVLAERHNERLEQFFADYEAYLAALLVWEERIALCTAPKLTLSNDGTAPANDIDVLLTFPPDLILMEADMMPKRPKAPKAPERSGDPRLLLGAFDPESMALNSGFLGPHINLHRSMSVGKAGRVNYWLKNLKHGDSEELEFVCFQFPDRKAVRAFHADYKISAAELPEAVKGQLHFVLPEGTAGG